MCHMLPLQLPLRAWAALPWAIPLYLSLPDAFCTLAPAALPVVALNIPDVLCLCL